jgi:transcriptional regulator with XRE-family HTH domain
MPQVGAALGATLRRLRKERGMSTRALASTIGVSGGLISQLENGITLPSLTTIIKLAGALGVSIGDLFDITPATTRLVRRDERPRYEYLDNGTVDEILSADPKQQLEVLYSYIKPGRSTGSELYTHDTVTTEVVLVVEGELILLLDEDRHSLGPGDALTFSGGTPHGYINQGSKTAEVIWVMTPAR